MFCVKCHVSFSKYSSYKIHVKKFHPDDYNEIPPYRPKDNAVAKCTICRKEFVRHSNWKTHMKRCHAAEGLFEKKVYNYKCDVCNNQFNHLRHFKSHQKSHELQSDTRNHFLKCPICREDFQKQAILEHFEEHHAIKIETEILQFNTAEKFTTWKTELEKAEKSSFVKTHGSYKVKDATKSEYICHRSGYFTPKGRGARCIKTQGTNKIDAFCPASLKVTETDNGFEVLYVKTHVGHDNDLEHVFMTKTDRLELAAKIAAKIPFDSILDGIRNSVTNGQLDRLHLLTKKDLFNLKQSYKLNNSSVWHENDAVSVEIISDTEEKITIVENDSLDSTVIIHISKEQERMDKDKFENELKELKATIMLHLDDIKTFDELEAVRNVCAHIRPTLDATRSSNTSNNVSHNKETTPKRRLTIQSKRKRPKNH